MTEGQRELLIGIGVLEQRFKRPHSVQEIALNRAGYRLRRGRSPSSSTSRV